MLVAVLVAIASLGCSVSVAVGSTVGSVVAVAVGRGVLVGRRVAEGLGSSSFSRAISTERSCWETAVASGSSESVSSRPKLVRPQQVMKMPAAPMAIILRRVHLLVLGGSLSMTVIFPPLWAAR